MTVQEKTRDRPPRIESSAALTNEEWNSYATSDVRATNEDSVSSEHTSVLRSTSNASKGRTSMVPALPGPWLKVMSDGSQRAAKAAPELRMKEAETATVSPSNDDNVHRSRSDEWQRDNGFEPLRFNKVLRPHSYARIWVSPYDVPPRGDDVQFERIRYAEAQCCHRKNAD